MIEFRQASTSELAQIQSWHRDEDFNIATGAGKGAPAEELARAHLERMVVDPPPDVRLAVAADGDTVLGYVIWAGMNDRHKSLEIHIAVNPKMHRQGIGRELLTRAVQRSFDNGVYRIDFRPMTRNKAAYELARSVGFTKEGATKASLWLIGIGPQTQWLMRMLKPEWEALENKKAS